MRCPKNASGFAYLAFFDRCGESCPPSSATGSGGQLGPPCGARKTLRASLTSRFSTAAEIASLLHPPPAAQPHLPPCRRCRSRACFATARQRRGCGESCPPSSATGSGGQLRPPCGARKTLRASLTSRFSTAVEIASLLHPPPAAQPRNPTCTWRRRGGKDRCRSREGPAPDCRSGRRISR